MREEMITCDRCQKRGLFDHFDGAFMIATDVGYKTAHTGWVCIEAHSDYCKDCFNYICKAIKAAVAPLPKPDRQIKAVT